MARYLNVKRSTIVECLRWQRKPIPISGLATALRLGLEEQIDYKRMKKSVEQMVTEAVVVEVKYSIPGRYRRKAIGYCLPGRERVEEEESE